MKQKPRQFLGELSHARVARTAFCGSLFGLCILAGAAEADPMVDFMIEQFQDQCDAEQANFRSSEDDVDAPQRGDLSLSKHAIYDIALTANSVTGTGLYNQFLCANI